MFKRSPSLVQQVKAHLKQRIIRVEFQDGRIPPEAELAAEMGVSRNTIRDALSQLETEGVIYRRQGAGTFVNQAGLLVKTRLDEIIPYETMIREHGFKPTVRLVGVDEITADPKLAANLNLPLEARLIVAQKLFLADERPVIFSCTYIPIDLIKQPYDVEDLRAPVYQFLSQFCQQEFGYYISEIVPVMAPEWLVERLILPPEKQVLISFEELGHNQDGEPVVMAYSYFRDDLIRLRLVRRQAQ